MDRGAWRATVHGVAKNRTQVSKFSHSVVPDSATPWTSARQAPLSRRFCRQGYWSGLPFPSPWDPPNPGIKPRSPALQADSLPAEPLSFILLLCLTLCNPMDCSTPGFLVPHHLLEFALVHIQHIGDVVQPSHPLMPSSPSALNLSQHQGLFQ